MDKGYYLKALKVDGNMSQLSQSTIKMDKGYYCNGAYALDIDRDTVAIHNKNGQGLLPTNLVCLLIIMIVAIHNKNGQGLLLPNNPFHEY